MEEELKNLKNENEQLKFQIKKLQQNVEETNTKLNLLLNKHVYIKPITINIDELKNNDLFDLSYNMYKMHQCIFCYSSNKNKQNLNNLNNLFELNMNDKMNEMNKILYKKLYFSLKIDISKDVNDNKIEHIFVHNKCWDEINNFYKKTTLFSKFNIIDISDDSFIFQF
jgi:hypothetical protein